MGGPAAMESQEAKSTTRMATACWRLLQVFGARLPWALLPRRHEITKGRRARFLEVDPLLLRESDGFVEQDDITLVVLRFHDRPHARDLAMGGGSGGNDVLK